MECDRCGSDVNGIYPLESGEDVCGDCTTLEDDLA